MATRSGFRPFYIPSTSGQYWKIYFHKPKGSLAYVAAAEGNLSGGSFTHRLYVDRVIRVNLPHRATRKAITDAGQELLRQMADNSYIFADSVSEYNSRLVK